MLRKKINKQLINIHVVINKFPEISGKIRKSFRKFREKKWAVDYKGFGLINNINIFGLTIRL